MPGLMTQHGRLDGDLGKHSETEALYATGIYVINPRCLSTLSPRAGLDILTDLVPAVREANGKVIVQQPDCAWKGLTCGKDIYQIISNALNNPGSFIRPQGVEVRAGVWAHRSATIHPAANITGPVYVGANTVVEEGSLVIGPTAINQSCRIGPLAAVMKSILLAGTYAQTNAIVDGQISHPEWSISHKFATRGIASASPMPHVTENDDHLSAAIPGKSDVSA